MSRVLEAKRRGESVGYRAWNARYSTWFLVAPMETRWLTKRNEGNVFMVRDTDFTVWSCSCRNRSLRYFTYFLVGEPL